MGPKASRAAVLMVATMALCTIPGAQGEGQAVPLPSPTDLPLHDVSFRSDGAVALAVGGAPGQGVVLRVAPGDVAVARQDGHRYLAAAWSPAEAVALVTGDGAVLRTRDGASFEDLPLPTGVAGFDGRAISWKADGSEALLAGSALLRYRAATGVLELVRQAADEAYGAVAWRPDGAVALVEQSRLEAAGWVAGRLLEFNGSGLRHVANYGTGQGLVEAIGWAASGAWALVLGHDGATGQGPVLRWDGAALTPAFTKAADRFTSLAWPPAGARALLTGSGGDVLADTDGSSSRVLLARGGDLLAAAWHPSGAHALLVGAGGALLQWLPEGRPGVRVLAPLNGEILTAPAEVVARPEARPGHGVLAVEARLDAGAWRALAAPTDGSAAWRLPLDPATLQDGAHLLEVRAHDDGAESEVVRVAFRVLRGLVAPSFADPPATDADGVVVLRWRGGGEAWQLQHARDPGFAVLDGDVRTNEPAATLYLSPAGTHHARVRAWVGEHASPWSAPAQVLITLTESPGAAVPGAAGSGADEGQGLRSGGADREAPGLEVVVLMGAGVGVAFARRRR